MTVKGDDVRQSALKRVKLHVNSECWFLFFPYFWRRPPFGKEPYYVGILLYSFQFHSLFLNFCNFLYFSEYFKGFFKGSLSLPMPSYEFAQL